MNAIASLSAPRADAGAVRHVFVWMRHQPRDLRARAASALARCYLTSALTPAERAEALVTMTAASRDPALCVRRALSEALAGAAGAPRHLVAALAQDRSEVACPLLAHSPRLSEALLAEVASRGEPAPCLAIARRPALGALAARALAGHAPRPAILALVGNAGAALDGATLRAIHRRFEDDGALREALLARGRLGPELRAELALSSARACAALGRSNAWLEEAEAERIESEAGEQALVGIAAACDPQDLPGFARHLQASGRLKPELLMRSLLGGDLSLFEAALAALTKAPLRRVAAFVADWRGRGFAALYARSELPLAWFRAFRAVLAVLEEKGGGVSRPLALEAIARCEATEDPALEPALALMWSLAGERARDGAPTPPAFDPGEAIARELGLAPAGEVAPELLHVAAPDAAPFDPSAAISLELDLALAEIQAALPAAEPGQDGAALPPSLNFEAANRNAGVASAA